MKTKKIELDFCFGVAFSVLNFQRLQNFGFDILFVKFCVLSNFVVFCIFFSISLIRNTLIFLSSCKLILFFHFEEKMFCFNSQK